MLANTGAVARCPSVRPSALRQTGLLRAAIPATVGTMSRSFNKNTSHSVELGYKDFSIKTAKSRAPAWPLQHDLILSLIHI